MRRVAQSSHAPGFSGKDQGLVITCNRVDPSNVTKDKLASNESKFIRVDAMASFLTNLWTRLVGERGHDNAEKAAAEAVEYKGFRIRPAPYPAKGQFQTAGVIEKDFEDGMKEHRFVRAETHPSKDDAAAFAVAKGRQIIDEQGERMFD